MAQIEKIKAEIERLIGQSQEGLQNKPAEWSENDTVFLNEITDFFENKTVRLQHDLDMYAHWLKSLPERFNPQPKQEWSEEDLQHKSWILECLADGKRTMPQYAADFNAAYNWLKPLRPQPKAKLTLLDENIITAAIAFVEQNEHFNCWCGIDKHTVIKALRSLKPHWKPSDEQMNALSGAIKCELSAGLHTRAGILQSLLDDLEKL